MEAIHMAFDCLALGVGLYASVMASWKPDERYSFGYGRVETLSGFANGKWPVMLL
jgi:zinc transporter 5/7